MTSTNTISSDQINPLYLKCYFCKKGIVKEFPTKNSLCQHILQKHKDKINNRKHTFDKIYRLMIRSNSK